MAEQEVDKGIKSVYLLQLASEHIRRLRRDNEILQAKVEVLNVFSCLLNLVPKRGVEMEEDIVWRIEKNLSDIRNKPEPPDAI